MATKDEPGLDAAYSLKTPEDSVRLYRDWAASYDDGFANERGYVLPRRLARIFTARSGSASGPVLDIGAGTGLVAEALAPLSEVAVDAIDISPDMLKVAEAKRLYRRRIVADLTQKLPIEDQTYAGLLSAGTFTLGHVGPDALYELLRVARPDAQFCIGVNRRAFDEFGFGSAFAGLTADNRITPVEYVRVGVYEGVEHDHSGDDVLVACFCKR